MAGSYDNYQTLTGFGMYVGSIEPDTPPVILSYVADGEVGFGRPVRLYDSELRTVREGVEGGHEIIDLMSGTIRAKLDKFFGVATCDPYSHGAADSVYRHGDSVNVLIGGSLYVENSRGHVISGSPVYIDITDSNFVGDKNDDSAQILGAIWLDNVTQGSIGRIRLVGANQVH